MTQIKRQTYTKQPLIRPWITIKFLGQFAIGILLAWGLAILIHYCSQGNSNEVQRIIIPIIKAEIKIVPTYLNLTLAGTLGGLLYSMLIDQTLEFPSWGKNDKGLQPGFLGDIFVGIAGAFIAYMALPKPLKEAVNGDYGEVGIMIFVAGLVGGYGGKYVLDAALQRLIKRIDHVDLDKEKLEQVSKVEELENLANRQIYQGLNPKELSNLQTQLQSSSLNPAVKKRIVERARDARRLGSRVKAYQDRINRVMPILEAVVQGEPNNDYYRAQLACAYRDYLPPRLDEAIAQFNEAIELRNSKPSEHNWHYELDRVVALIRKASQEGETNEESSPSSQRILSDLLTIDHNRGLGRIFLEFDPGRTKPIQDWLEKNQDWVKQFSGGSSLLKQALAGTSAIPTDYWHIAPPHTTIKAITATYLKKQLLQASELSDNQKEEVPVGKQYPILKYLKVTDGHYQIELDHNAGIWYIWSDHWDLPWEDVPSKSQKMAQVGSAQQPSSSPIQVTPSTVPSLSLRGSVGRGGTNNADDVAKVKQRLKALGFDWFKPGSQEDPGLIQAINLFQSIINGKTAVRGDGRIDVNGKTHQWLRASNAPRWMEMPIEGSGYVNYERRDNKDHHDYGTSWLADAIIAAGKHYEENYRRGNPHISPLPINDVSLIHGGDTPDHGGHECGNACDIYLPRKGGGYSLPSWTDPKYDRDAARAIIQALRTQPLVRKDRIFFNDTKLIQEGLCKHLGGHHHHIHFEIGVPQRAEILEESTATLATFAEPSSSLEDTKKLSSEEFKYIYPPPISYEGRQFIVTIPSGYEQKALGPEEYAKAASEFGLEVAVVRAVVDVEASGSGFLLNEPAPARPKILFEAHHFYRLTPKPVSKTRPDLSSPRWNRSLYKGGSGEWTRLIDAMEFDPIPAIMSASWGLGQVMGFNYKVAGCSSVEQMVVEAHQGEYQQLRHMLNFCKNNNLIPALQNKDWARFARGYNGPSYRANNYHVKLANSYRRWQQKVA